MKIVALAGGIGAGKFLRGLLKAAPDPSAITVVVNTGDDIAPYGVHVSPDVDSVIYWLSGAGDRERGWGRGDETFRATTELRERFEAADAWFGLGDLDLATNLFRTGLLRDGATLTEATSRVASAFGITPMIVPMSDDRVTTRIATPTADLHFQEYWVRDRAEPTVTGVTYDGADAATPSPRALTAIEDADAIIICPSNPVASIGPILAVGELRAAIAARSDRVVGISPIVGGAPLRGMADKLMPAVGLEVSALGAAQAYRDLLTGWIIDDADAHDAARIAADLGVIVRVMNTVMAEDDDTVAIALATAALDMVRT